MNASGSKYTTADALLDALHETGISYFFSNLGSDHPAMIESLAKAKAVGKEMPQVIICPHEYIALTAAHGYYLASGEAQGVFVHTDVGTQNLGGSLHNASRSRVPVFIFSGETPYTLQGELPGSRNSQINFLQNVYDQRGIARNYVKWEGDIRTGTNVKQVVYRAMQLANSDPKGPVYLTGAREVLEEEITTPDNDWSRWKPVEVPPLSAAAVERIVTAIAVAERPLVLTSYAGRNEESIQLLVDFCERLAVPVIEPHTSYVNFPGTHPLHQGYSGGELLQEADVVLVIDSDVPWVLSKEGPKDDCRVFHIDIDPLKRDIPLWHIPTEASYQADSSAALRELNRYAAAVRKDDGRNAVCQRRFVPWFQRRGGVWREACQTRQNGGESDRGRFVFFQCSFVVILNGAALSNAVYDGHF
ncbi:thiamine pyrophosphate-binding protein [Ferviditalea candida]|uniref:thiamine pyrophosphate-binding protein n=1 Tax=Ferviditalea candida TaxID=3108399 RepID=UPI003FA3C8A9